jgi:hypothetical protein
VGNEVEEGTAHEVDRQAAPIGQRLLVVSPALANRFAVARGGARRRRRPTRLAALVVSGLAISGALGPPAGAAKVVGISEQHPEMFASPLFQTLDLPIARLIVAYDAVVRHTREVAAVDAWVRAAQADGVEPLISFNHTAGCYTARGRVPHLRKCRLPTVAAYRRAFVAFRHRYPGLKVYSPWNEANHRSQPTGRNPRAAARFYNVVRTNCRGCTIVAADVLDQAGMAKWLRTFRHYARGNPRIWGLHNYIDANNHTTSGTRAMLRAVRGQVWLTETGGIVKFLHRPFSPGRAARATEFTFHLANLSSRITRIYIYQWTGARRGDRFDAGLTSPLGQPRPAYFVLKRHVRKRPVKPPYSIPPPPRPAPSPSPPASPQPQPQPAPCPLAPLPCPA